VHNGNNRIKVCNIWPSFFVIPFLSRFCSKTCHRSFKTTGGKTRSLDPHIASRADTHRDTMLKRAISALLPRGSSFFSPGICLLFYRHFRTYTIVTLIYKKTKSGIENSHSKLWRHSRNAASIYVANVSQMLRDVLDLT